jgi:hypothetical protein
MVAWWGRIREILGIGINVQSDRSILTTLGSMHTVLECMYTCSVISTSLVVPNLINRHFSFVPSFGVKLMLHLLVNIICIML